MPVKQEVESPIPVSETVATEQVIKFPDLVSGVGATDEEIETVFLGVDISVQRMLGSLWLNPRLWVLRTVLPQVSVAPEVEAVVPTVSSEVTTSIATTVEPEAPIADSFVESVQPSSSPAITEGNS